MSIVWIVEKAAPSRPTLASALIGDFAVRAFGSLETFEKLLRLSRTQRPDLLLVDCAGGGLASGRLKALLETHMTGVPAVLVDPPADGAPLCDQGDDRIFAVPRPADGLGLSALVNFALRAAGTRRGRRAVVRFRDVLLDYDKLQCLIVPGDEPVSLPLKEAQLLKLFLDHAGECLSRDEIQGIVWENVKVTPRTVDSHVCRLRKRLADAEVRIESVYGGGYVLK